MPTGKKEVGAGRAVPGALGEQTEHRKPETGAILVELLARGSAEKHNPPQRGEIGIFNGFTQKLMLMVFREVRFRYQSASHDLCTCRRIQDEKGSVYNTSRHAYFAARPNTRTLTPSLSLR